MKRIPLFLFISSLLAIIAYENKITLIFSCVLFFIAIFILKVDDLKVIGVICILFFMLVFIRMGVIDHRTTSLDVNTDGTTLQGKIVSFPIYKEGKAQFLLKIFDNDYETVQAFIYDNTHSLDYGEVINFTGRIKVPDGKRNPGGFDYKKYLKGKNIYTVLYINDKSLIINEDHNLTILETMISTIRNSFMDFIENNFTVREKGFLIGLILGEKGVDPQTIDHFNKLGVSHILSVSGLHVGYVYIFVNLTCNFLKLNKKIKMIIVSVLLYIYCFIVGFSASVVRASLMFVLLLFAEVMNKKYDTLNILSLLASISILYNPYVVYNAGFQLSYGAVLSITILYPYINNKIKVTKKYFESIKSLILLTISVQIGTIPLVLYHFQNISLISLFANLFIVPLVGVIIVGFLLVFLISIVLHVSVPILTIPITFCIHFIFMLSDQLAKIPFAFMTLSPMSLIIVLLYYFTLLLMFGYFYHYKNKNRKIVVIVFSVYIFCIFIISIYPLPLKVTFLDVGQGDSALIELPTGTNILIDGGGQMNYSVGDYIIQKVLMAKNIQCLDVVVCTHSHDDHMLGIIEIIDDIKIESIVINSLEKDGYKELISLANEYDIPVYKNDEIKLKLDEEIRLEFLYPTRKTPYIDENNSSIITKLTYDEISFLFMGDLEQAGEKILLERNEIANNEFIKIGHHGSKTSTGNEFLDMVNPLYGIISVGENNYYDHPNNEVLDALINKDIHTYRTDEVGAVEIKTNGKDIKITTYEK